MGRPGPPWIRLASLCNRGAQTCGSVSCSTQEPMPKVALVAARLGRRPNTNREWEASGRTLILGEHTANLNSPRARRFFAIGDAVENESGWPVPRCPRATLCSESAPDPQDRLKYREQEVPGIFVQQHLADLSIVLRSSAAVGANENAR
jgi:hypothetical protein